MSAPSCRQCGVEIREDSRFCDNCGAPVEESTDRGVRFGNLPDSHTGGDQLHLDARSSPTESASVIGDGRYHLVELIGEGSKKRVYLADDTRLKRKVALATLDIGAMSAEDRARTEREIRTAAKLGDHPRIVPVYDVGTEGDTLYLVSQYMAGGDLSSSLTSEPLPTERAMKIVRQVAEALAYAHSKGVWHRDVKPANILLTPEGDAKLGDFGLAVAADQSRVTAEGVMIGTLAYMAPESVLGSGLDAGAPADIYSLGIVAYELLTGRPPFVGTPDELVSQHVSARPLPPKRLNPDLPDPLDDLVSTMLEKRPEARPSSVESVVRTIAAMESLTSGSAAALRSMGTEARRAPREVFVGRERELEELQRDFEDAIAGSGRAILLPGEPGIGKSRLVEQVATYVELRGGLTVTGNCYEGEGAPPYWPWVQMLRVAIDHLETPELKTALGVGVREIAQMLPELTERLPDIPGPRGVENEESRFRVFDAISQVLTEVSDKQPLLLVIEDAHWADEASLLMLEFFSRHLRESRILLFVTYRDTALDRRHPIHRALGALSRAGVARRVALTGLEKNQVREVITTITGAEPTEALVEAVCSRTEGNPFYVREVVTLLAKSDSVDGAMDPSELALRIPESVREVIGQRIGAISDRAIEVLTTAAAAGRDFEFDVVREVVGLDLDELFECLEEAEVAGLISESGAALGKYRFSHALINEALYDELSPTRRAVLHNKIAEALERLAHGSDDHLSGLAYHYTKGMLVGSKEKAAEYTTRAARQALAQSGFEEAIRLSESALSLIEATDRKARFEILTVLGMARVKVADVTASKDAFREAADIAEKLEDNERFAQAALGFGAWPGRVGGPDPELIDLLNRALGKLDRGDSEMRARLLARLGAEISYLGEFEQTRQVVDESVAMARRLGDDHLLASNLVARHWALWGSGDARVLRSTADEVVELARTMNDTELELNGHIFRAIDEFESVNPGGAAEAARQVERLAEELRLPLYRWVAALLRTMQLTVTGKLTEAEAQAAEALEIGQSFGSEDATFFYGLQLYMIRKEEGRLGELEPVVAQFAEEFSNIPGLRAAQALVLVEGGKLEDAREILEEMATDDFKVVKTAGLGRMACAALLAEVCVALRDAPKARWLYDFLETLEGTNLVIGPTAVSYGSCSRIRGNLAALMGMFGIAETHFMTAISGDESMGMLPGVARDKLDFAEMLVRNGEHERARSLASDALEIAVSLGLEPLASRARALLG